MHRERGALDSAAFKISPYKLGGRPLQGLRPGAMPPPCPPPRYATGSPPPPCFCYCFQQWRVEDCTCDPILFISTPNAALSWNSTGKIGRIGRHLAEQPDVEVTMCLGPMPPDASDFPGGIPTFPNSWTRPWIILIH